MSHIKVLILFSNFKKWVWLISNDLERYTKYIIEKQLKIRKQCAWYDHMILFHVKNIHICNNVCSYSHIDIITWRKLLIFMITGIEIILRKGLSLLKRSFEKTLVHQKSASAWGLKFTGKEAEAQYDKEGQWAGSRLGAVLGKVKEKWIPSWWWWWRKT